MEFGKLDEHSKINAQGTGLGLSICKRMIQKMGGQVTVDSEFGVGTTFTISVNTRAKVMKAPKDPAVPIV
jgi:signal transduction histidine kinase